MAKAISWVAVNKRGELCLDPDPSPLPRGWERCLDLQSGVMYMKQMNTSSQQSDNNEKAKAIKRQKFSFEDNSGGDDDNPGLQLSLSLPTSTLNSSNSCRIPHPCTQCSPSKSIEATPAIPPLVSERAPTHFDNSATLQQSSPLSEAGWISLSPTKEIESTRDATTSSNGSSLSCNASSSSSSSLSFKGSQYGGLRPNHLGLEGLNQERNLIKVAGCPHCFMYVLPSRDNPKCPRCKNSILVDLSSLTTH